MLLPHVLDRTIEIRATPDTVFGYFTDSARWASWWGAGSSIDPRPGGPLVIRYPDGTEVRGEVLDINPPRRIVFTYGYASGQMIAPGGSRVTIDLEATADGTRLTLTHEFADAAVRDQHVQGWRYQLSVFANVVLDTLHAGAPDLVDRWFQAWAETDADVRRTNLAMFVAGDVRFRDRFSATAGLDDLVAHITATQRFMPGTHPVRAGDVRHCQGFALADWTVSSFSGTNHFTLDAHGRIAAVVGFWNSGRSGG